ncbi:hypothetical protein PGC08_10160 [Brevibacterium sp. BDJS002]|uniref:hypothetical protein n=1 Tax=Brevibacterium sp. BDJS002 TaxID=3020906 RepID=UPI002307738F|nr:hypothetical protein [Brevibacterium sp. BDJS002]MDN5773590.1 hypothetical protein [Brevibacterium aurantiacum]WCE38403.1 hypothetical protein PGC08_10160 [Brevibacterium sp. BDJS002]
MDFTPIRLGVDTLMLATARKQSSVDIGIRHPRCLVAGEPQGISGGDDRVDGMPRLALSGNLAP